MACLICTERCQAACTGYWAASADLQMEACVWHLLQQICNSVQQLSQVLCHLLHQELKAVPPHLQCVTSYIIMKA